MVQKREDEARPVVAKVRRGFAAMSAEVHRQLSAQGGRNVQSAKRAFSRNHELAVKAGRKGGSQGYSVERVREERAALCLSGKRIIVVEDDFLLAEDIVDVLSSLGAQIVGPFPTLSAALGQLQGAQPRPDGAVLDINLRDGTVYPLAASLRDQGIPYVFVTGNSRRTIPLEYAWVPLFEKPIQARELAGRLTF